MKIIKHCKEEGAGELSQGVLSGLLNNNTVEVTNCFPRPSNENDDFDERKLLNFCLRETYLWTLLPVSVYSPLKENYSLEIELLGSLSTLSPI